MKFFLNIKISFPSLAPVSSTLPFSRLDNLTPGLRGWDGLFQLPSLTRMLVCEAWTKQEWELSRIQSLVLVWPATLLRFRWSFRLAVNFHALSLTLIHLPTFPASNALEFCVNIIPIYGDVRNDFQRFAENFGRRTDDLQLLPKLSKDCWRFQKTTTMRLDTAN